MRTIIDGNSLLFRAYYGVRGRLTLPDGTPVNAVYGFCNMVLPLIEAAAKDDEFICVFDAHRRNWRNDIFPEYKMNRSDTPPDLVPQFQLAQDAARAMGMPVLVIDNVEADDVIATLAQESCPTRIMSSDKDLTQLLADPCIHIFDSMKDAQIRADDVIAKFGVSAAQMVDYQSLVGDSSDNVPGVCGIGPKKAAELLTEFGTLAAIYENLPRVKNDRVRGLLEAGRDSAFVSQQLVRLKNDVEIPAFEKFKFNAVAAQKFFAEKMGSRTLAEKARKMGDLHHNAVTPAKAGVHCGQSDFDFATTDCLQAMDPGLRRGDDGVNYGAKNKVDDSLFLFSLDDYIGALGVATVWEKLANPAVKKVAYDWKTIFHKLDEMGFDSRQVAPIDDVMLMNYAANRDSSGDVRADYADFMANPAAIYEIDLAILRPLYEMERAGIRLDTARLSEISKKLHSRLADLQTAIWAIAGLEFNIASPKQLAEVLFDKMRLPAGKSRSTDVDVLEAFAAEHEIARLVLEYRTVAKLIGTYTDALPKLLGRDGRIHTTFLQTSTNTGRLSSRNPNMQNIPIRTDEGGEIRKCFVSAPGNMLISADYSQIQLRVLAHIADITSWKSAFTAGRDIHIETAERLFGVATPDNRRIAKTVNFSIIYGVSAHGLALQLGIGRSAAQAIIDNYMTAIPEIRAYIENTKQVARERGFIETMFGRRIYFPDINAKGPRRAFSERAAINAPIQGAEADIVRVALARLAAANLPAKMLLQVHDEIVFECPADVAEFAAREIKRIMESVVELSVPLSADYTISERWEK